MKWLEMLMDSPVAWALLSIIAIAGFAYAIICQHINKEKKELSYVKKSNALIREKKSKYDKLSIVYNGQQIDSLCVTNIALWNSGNRTINRTDIVESKEVTITALDDNIVLDVEIVACSEETNKFSVNKADEHSVEVDFDYADIKDGVAMQIIHTGTEDSISVDCKIKGGKPIRNHINDKFPKLLRKIIKPEMLDRIMAVVSGTVILLFLLMALTLTIAYFVPYVQNTTEGNISTEQLSQKNVAASAVMFWVSGLTLAAMYIPLIKKLFRIGMPRKIKKHL